MKRASAGEENLRVLIFRLAANERAYDMFNYKRTFFVLATRATRERFRNAKPMFSARHPMTVNKSRG